MKDGPSLFFGLLAQNYSSGMKLIPLPDGPARHLDVKGSGMILGASFGIAGGTNAWPLL